MFCLERTEQIPLEDVRDQQGIAKDIDKKSEKVSAHSFSSQSLVLRLIFVTSRRK